MKRPHIIILIALTIIGIAAGMTAVDFFRKRNCVKIVRNGNAVEVWKYGELLLEFTPQNTDSASMQTLRHIERAANEKAPEN